MIDQALNAFLVVAFIEEFSKFLFVSFILYYNKNFNEPFDGIVYAVIIGMGFATFENILYVFEFGIPTGMLRMFTAVPAHATFAILMGYFPGKAKFLRTRPMQYSLAALAVPTFFHCAYDTFGLYPLYPGFGSAGLFPLS